MAENEIAPITTKEIKEWSPIAIKVDVAVTTGAAEVTSIVCVADVAGSLGGKYFLIDGIDATGRVKKFYVWIDVDNGSSDPNVSGRTAIEVDITAGATAAQVATAVQTAINAVDEFGASVVTDTVTVTNANKGDVSNAVDVDTGFTISTTTGGADNDYALINANQHVFNFDFEFHSIQVIAETNTLASILLSINETIYPEQTYLIDANENFKMKRTCYADGYFIDNSVVNEYPIKVKVPHGWILRIYGRNAHTSTQYVKLIINGWKTYQCEGIGQVA